MTPCSELDRLFAKPFPSITPPISLADAALAEAHMTQHEAENGICVEGESNER